MEYVEQGILRGPEVEGYLLDKLEPYLKVPIDAVVLGCTHYPFCAGQSAASSADAPRSSTAASALQSSCTDVWKSSSF